MNMNREMRRQLERDNSKLIKNNVLKNDVIPVSAVETLLAAQKTTIMTANLIASLTVLKEHFSFSTEQIKSFSDLWMDHHREEAKVSAKSINSGDRGQG